MLMEQPEYIVLNPIYNSYPNNWTSYKYMTIDTPYVDISGEIRWNRVRKLQPGIIYTTLKDVTNYEEYLLERMIEIENELR
jgi:hypothetical protein